MPNCKSLIIFMWIACTHEGFCTLGKSCMNNREYVYSCIGAYIYSLSCARPCARMLDPIFLIPPHHALKLLCSAKSVTKSTGF